MNVVVAGDHYTVELLQKITGLLKQRGFEVTNVGAKSKEDKLALQTFIPSVAKQILDSQADFGILACGTGVGVEIGANRFKGIRAALCRDAEQAKFARVYDDANVLCLGSWYKDDFEAILQSWLGNKFDGGERRTEQLDAFDVSEFTS